jgi:hypothetical protein
MALGSVAEAIDSGAPAGAIESERLVVTVCMDTESFTVTAIGKLPLAVGVPEITPVLAARLRPEGRLPDVMDQE